MNSLKKKNMIANYDGFKGSRTVESIQSQIPDQLWERLTGRELGLVMTAINKAYHNGRGSLGGIDKMDDCVWFPWGGEIKTECGVCNTDDPDKCICVDKIGTETGMLIPIDAIKNIKIADGKEEFGGNKYSTRTYTMDYKEKF
jgi:hypothetical protein